MEDLLLLIVKESQNAKLSNVRKAAQDAYDFMEKQQGLLRDPPHELRSKCLYAIQLALETKRSKLVSYGLTGLHKILRDDRFQSPYEPEDDSLWLPAQMLHAMGSILSQSDDTQTDMLKVLLQVACSAYWTMNGRLIIAILTTCCEAFENGNQAVRTAAQAATSQTLRSFCLFLDEECRELDEYAKKNKNLRERGVSCFNEALPILQYICSRLDEAQRKKCSNNTKNGNTIVFLLECLHTLISSLPQKIHTNTHFTTFLWQKFCPALIAFLGTPRVDKTFTSREGRDTEVGRGSGYLATTLSFDSHQSKTVYSIGIELVRLVGCVGSLRPVLESVFHRMLLYPPPQQRLESLKAVRELLRSPSRMVDFSGPLLVEEEKTSQPQSDMALMRLVMDSIEESTTAGQPVLYASVSCVVAMLSALQELCEGKAISHSYICTINALYDDLESCDYRGPLTYQSMSRLPKTYREQLELMKKSTGSESDSSGHGPSEDGDSTDTEGPQNESDDVADDNSLDENDYAIANERERLRLEKLPKCLHVGRQFAEECNVDVERHNARQFVKILRTDLIPLVLNLRSNIEVDEALQNFASEYCQGVFASQQKIQDPDSADAGALITIMNADGIYLATYAALLLNLKLIKMNYYSYEGCQVPMSEEQFVEEVHGSGVLVYLSATWLSELYQQILACNLLEKCGYNPVSTENCALVNILVDVDGISGSQRGGQLLSDYRRLEKAQLSRSEATPEEEAGAKLSRRVLTCCWTSMMTVLTAGLNPVKEDTSKGILNRDNARRGVRDTVVLALEGLHKAATLSNVLGLQSRCGSIFALLAKAACTEPAISKLRRTKDVLRLKLQNRATNLHTSHALSMEVLLGRGLELGSHGSDCWPHVFTCCLYVSKLEHDFFGRNQNLVLPKLARKEKKECQIESKVDKNRLNFNIIDEDETCVDVYSFLSTPYSQNPTTDTVPDIIQESNADNQFNGILPADYAAKIICVLSQQVDRLFEDAALKLNLKALCSFLTALCKASKDQLFKSADGNTDNRKFWFKKSKPREEELNVLLLSRLGEVMLKCVKSGRPLIHIMRIWSVLGPHFMEAACHKDREISKKAVQCIHDSMAALLNEQIELPHFHFNEALFKPFENLLCLELCDSDVQDQIVSCICEFVETNRTEIRSGWRPLFGALRVASVGSSDSVESAPLLEVFRVFLSTDNTLVFANAALDCILCLLKHVRGTGEAESSTDSDQITNLEIKKMRLCLESLKYLLNCSDILSSMYRMPACPIFHSAAKIQVSAIPQYVDPVIPNLEVAKFDKNSDTMQEIIPEVSYELLSKLDKTQTITLQSMEKPSGILRVWYLLIEGLASATMICPRRYQPHTLETLFHLLRDVLNVPGPAFGLYCVNHLLLPMVQNWLRMTSKIFRGWDNFAPNFKQCCGLTTDLVVDYLTHLQGPEVKRDDELLPATTLMLKQLLLVMAECVVQQTESIARLGCACIRHVLISSGPILTAEQWEVCGIACYRACSNSLQELHQLTMAFSPRSESFYGDIAQVKVAARRDATPEESERLRQLSSQVFLMAEQRSDESTRFSDDRSYVFLLYPPSVASTLNPDLYIVRVHLRALVVGLLVHQMLLHCIASVLLQDSIGSISNFCNVIMTPTSPTTPKPIGHVSNLSPKHIDIFLTTLDLSFAAALKFDSRPGLKFLIQKVANLQQPANLYRQAGAAWTIKILTIFNLCLNEIIKTKADLECIKKILSNQIGFKKNQKTQDSSKELLIKYIKQLKVTFDSLVDTYVDVIINKDGKHSVADGFAERKIFLLVAQPDDFPEITSKEPMDERLRSLDNESLQQHDVIVSNANQNREEKKNSKIDEEYRSLKLFDMASDYYVESGPESESDSDESRPSSRPRSRQKTIVYRKTCRYCPKDVDEHENTSDLNVNSSSNVSERREKLRTSDEDTDKTVEDVTEDNLENENVRKIKKKFKSNEKIYQKMNHKVFNDKSMQNSIEKVNDLTQVKCKNSKTFCCRSEKSILSRRNSLKIVLNHDSEEEFSSSISKKSKSLMELHRINNCGLSQVSSFLNLKLSENKTCKVEYIVTDSCKSQDRSSNHDLNNKNDNNDSDDDDVHAGEINSVFEDSVDDLLRDYEKSKRGFRTNPFLCNVENNISAENYERFGVEGTKKSFISKDSEAHRRAWAETLSASLEWTLALPDESLTPLLPVLVGGIRTLTKFAVDANLKQKISALFHRIIILYGLTNN
ncbi:brefeldin A-inhibited guanine nucleotide-exchange protein 3 [Chelonus insularis]|nr:brefeldin A-inhibited guanine nucleotide-exchange protein 3 [Chelonus insularis]